MVMRIGKDRPQKTFSDKEKEDPDYTKTYANE